MRMSLWKRWIGILGIGCWAAGLVGAAESSLEGVPDFVRSLEQEQKPESALAEAASFAVDLTFSEFQTRDATEATQGNDLVDIEIRWDGTQERYSGIWFPVTGTIQRVIQVGESAFNTFNAGLGAGRYLDIEYGLFNGTPLISAIYLEGDGYASTILLNADEAFFRNALSSEFRNGYSIVDFEAMKNASGQVRYSGLWVHEPNQPKTHLYFPLEWADLIDLASPLAGRVIDVERFEPYDDPTGTIRYALITAMYPGGEWGVVRHLSDPDLIARDQSIADADTFLVDVESYDNGGPIQHLGVWGDTYKTLHEVASIPADANPQPLSSAINTLISNFEAGNLGKAGFWARSVRGEESIAYREEESFYLASTAKIPIHVKLWKEIQDDPGLDDETTGLFYTDTSSSGASWYVDERNDPGFSTGLFGNDMGTQFTLGQFDTAMMRRSDNAATSALVDDPTVGVSYDSTDLNEWLSGLSGIGQGFGAVTSIHDVDRAILWHGQWAQGTEAQSLFLAPGWTFEPLFRNSFRVCQGGTIRCDANNPCAPNVSCIAVQDPWGGLQGFLGSPLFPNFDEAAGYARYYPMGLNSATPQAFGRFLEALAKELLLDPDHTAIAIDRMNEGTPLNNDPAFPSHIVVHAKGGIKGGDSAPCSDAAVFTIGPDTIVGGIYTQDNSLPCFCSSTATNCTVSVRNSLTSQLALEMVRSLTADLQQCDVNDASFSPAVIGEGQTFDVNCDVSNVGHIDAPAFDVRYYVSDDSAIGDADDILIGTVPFNGGLVAQDVAPARFLGAFPGSIPDGEYYVGWIIDETDEVGEFDETSTSNRSFILATKLQVLPPCPDDDGDGWVDCDGTCSSGGLGCGECNDADPLVNPGQIEFCNQIDDDCSGITDDPFPMPLAERRFVDPLGLANDDLGRAIAPVGDVNADGAIDFVAGVPQDDTLAPNAGAAILFSGADGSVLCTMTAPGGVFSDFLGSSVAGIGDVSGDGVADIAAGAPFTDVPASGSGSVLLFSGADCSFLRELIDPLGLSGDELGYSVAGIDDLDGDTVPDVLSGARRSDLLAVNAGAVIAFSGLDGSVIYRATDPAGGGSDELGWSITAIGDVDTDGVADFVSGAPFNDQLASNGGALVVFSGASGSAIDRIYGSSYSGNFGHAVARSEDLDGDSLPDILVGAPKDDGPGSRFGAVYALSGADRSTIRVFSDPTGAINDSFGEGVAGMTDVSGDGVPEVLVGVPQDDDFGTGFGTLQVFDGATGARLQRIGHLDPPFPIEFGKSVAAFDASGDGMPELVTGAPHAPNPYEYRSGAVLLYSFQSDCDGDGVSLWAGDCDDSDLLNFPGNVEVCDGQDNDCDAAIDEDSDGDGVAVCADCNDLDPTIFPGAAERCNGIDDDCSGPADDGPDLDGDTFTQPCDCNDVDALIHPGATESCNKFDDDCDGTVDEIFSTAWSGKRFGDVGLTAGVNAGAAIDVVGDVDFDGVRDLVVGVPSAQFGRALLVSGADLSVLCTLVEPSLGLSDRLGYAVAGIGDATGDNIPDIAVGAPFADVAANNVGAVVLFSGATCASFRTLSDPGGAPGDQLGNSVARLGDLDGDGIDEIVAGAPQVNDPVTLSGAVLVFDGADGTLLYKLTDPQETNRLGASVAGPGDVNGDGVPDIVAGAPFDNNFAGTAGAAYVFSGADGSLIRKLIDPDGGTSDDLGHSLAGVGDVNGDGFPDIAVGAIEDDIAASNAGAVVVFSGRDGEVIHKLFDPGASTFANLGASVAGPGDVNGDGVPDIAAGAMLEDQQALNAGALLVFSGADGSVIAKLTDPAGQALDELGSSIVAVDLDGDRIAEIIGGAPEADTIEENGVGTVVVFSLRSDCDGDGLSDFAGDCDDADAANFPGNTEVCDAADNDCDSVVDEDSDGDGFDVCADCSDGNPTIFPGAVEVCNGLDDDCNGPADDGSDLDGDLFSAPCDCNDTDVAVNPGATEICNHVDDDCDGAVDPGFPTPFDSTRVNNPDASPVGDQLGHDLAIVGDVNGDGIADLVAGMPSDSTIALSAGAAILLSGAGLTPVCKLLDPTATSSDFLGWSVTGLGDVTGDGVPDIAAGLRNGVGAVPNSGSVAIFSGADCSWIETIHDPNGNTSDQFGQALGRLSDVTGDGIDELIVGANLVDTAGDSNRGKAYVYSGADRSLLFELDDPAGRAGDGLGYSVAGIDDVTGDGVADVLASAPFDNAEGSISIFSGTDGAFVRKLLDSATSSSDGLGRSVAPLSDFDGDGFPDVLAGVPGEDLAGSNAGAVVVFSGRSGIVLARYTDPTPGNFAAFGQDVAGLTDLDGDGVPEILVSANKDDDAGLIDAGSVRVLSGADGSALARLSDPNGAANDELGFSIVVLDDFSGGGPPEIVAGSRFAGSTGALLVFSLEADCDGDGISPLGDCDDLDPLVESIPGDVEGLRFTDSSTLVWDLPSGTGGDPTALVYDVVRTFDVSDFPGTGSCLEPDDGSDTQAIDVTLPAPGIAWFYLVRAQNGCGEGSFGQASDLVDRVGPPCP